MEIKNIKQMRTKLTIILTMLTFACFGQGYKAVNGVTYNVGDTLTLNVGSATDGSFQYFQLGGLKAGLTADMNKGKEQFNMGSLFSGLKIVVKKIKTFKALGQSKTYFVIEGGYYLYIDDAIKAKEIL